MDILHVDSPSPWKRKRGHMSLTDSAAGAVDAALASFYRAQGAPGPSPEGFGGVSRELKGAYISAYARNAGGALDAVSAALADSLGREPTEGELADAAVALAGRQAEDDAGLLSRMFTGQAAALAEEYAPVLARTFERERAASIEQGRLSAHGGEARKPTRRSM